MDIAFESQMLVIHMIRCCFLMEKSTDGTKRESNRGIKKRAQQTIYIVSRQKKQIAHHSDDKNQIMMLEYVDHPISEFNQIVSILFELILKNYVKHIQKRQLFLSLWLSEGSTPTMSHFVNNKDMTSRRNDKGFYWPSHKEKDTKDPDFFLLFPR